jgi:hypothetical protein
LCQAPVYLGSVLENKHRYNYWGRLPLRSIAKTG